MDKGQNSTNINWYIPPCGKILPKKKGDDRMRLENQDNLAEVNNIIEKYMRIAIEEAEIAKKKGENPFGAVLLDPEYNFCHKAHTRSIELSDPTAHAEVLVISEYCKKTKMVYLKDYILISSTEPCVMCSGAIKWAKIGQIYYSVPQKELNKISGGKQKPTCESLINSGFSQKHIVGNVLLNEGLKVYDNFKFAPQDERK